MSRIALISCTSKNEAHSCPAVELYSKSPTFRLAYILSGMVADEIYILSAKHGNQPGNMSIMEVRQYITNLLQQKKAEGESTYTLRAGDLQKNLGLANATPTVCDAMTKKINYEYEIMFAPPKGKSTRLTVKYKL